MLRTSAIILGSTVLVSPENVFRTVKRNVGQSFKEINADKREDRKWEHADRQNPRATSINPKFGGGSKKCSPTVRPLSHGSAVMAIPGVHVPEDYNAEYLVRRDYNGEIFAALTGANLLSWFETQTEEGKVSLESLQAVKDQAATAKHNLLVAASSGTDEELVLATKAVEFHDGNVKVAEQHHFDKAHSKHSLAKEKIAKDKGNSAKVIAGAKSLLGSLEKPGIHLPARQTPKAIRAITTDNNGKVTGAPSADRITVDGNRVLVEGIEASADDLAADKKESGQSIKKGPNKLDALISKEDEVGTLAKEVARLEVEKAEHGFAPKGPRAQDLARLTKELKAKETRLLGELLDVRHVVKVKGVKVITDSPDSKKVGTVTCAKHAGRLSCKCHREVLLDANRGISKRTKA